MVSVRVLLVLGVTLLELQTSVEAFAVRDLFPGWRARRSDAVCTEYKEFKRVLGYLGTPTQVRIGGSEVTADECKEACSSYEGGSCVAINLYQGSVGPCKLILAELVADDWTQHSRRVCETGDDCYQLEEGQKMKAEGRSFVTKQIPTESQSLAAAARSFCIAECSKYDVCVGFDLISNSDDEYEKCTLSTMGKQDSTASSLFIRRC